MDGADELATLSNQRRSLATVNLTRFTADGAVNGLDIAQWLIRQQGKSTQLQGTPRRGVLLPDNYDLIVWLQKLMN